MNFLIFPQETRAVDNLGFPVKNRLEKLPILVGVKFEVGILQ